MRGPASIGARPRNTREGITIERNQKGKRRTQTGSKALASDKSD